MGHEECEECQKYSYEQSTVMSDLCAVFSLSRTLFSPNEMHQHGKVSVASARKLDMVLVVLHVLAFVMAAWLCYLHIVDGRYTLIIHGYAECSVNVANPRSC